MAFEDQGWKGIGTAALTIGKSGRRITSKGTWKPAAAFAMFTAIAAVSGATSVIVLDQLKLEGDAGIETASLVGEAMSREAAASLARAVLLRLDDANKAGNYAIFRGIAAPGFQSINSAEDLERIFAWLRRERINLGAAAGLDRSSMGPPILEPRGLLRLTGKMPANNGSLNSGPMNFDLMFQSIDNEWRLFGIAVFKG